MRGPRGKVELRAAVLVTLNVLVAIWVLASPPALGYAAFPGYGVYVFLGLALATSALLRYFGLYMGPWLNLTCLIVGVFLLVASFAPAHIAGRAAMNDTIMGAIIILLTLWNWLDVTRRQTHPATM